MIDYNQNLTKNRDWRSVLIALAVYPTLLYQVLILSLFDCNNREKAGLWIIHVALLPNLISPSRSLKLPRQTVHG